MPYPYFHFAEQSVPIHVAAFQNDSVFRPISVPLFLDSARTPYYLRTRAWVRVRQEYEIRTRTPGYALKEQNQLPEIKNQPRRASTKLPEAQ